MTYLAYHSKIYTAEAVAAARKAEYPKSLDSDSLNAFERDLFELGFSAGYDTAKGYLVPESDEPESPPDLDDENTYKALIKHGELKSWVRYDNDVMGKLLVLKVKIKRLHYKRPDNQAKLFHYSGHSRIRAFPRL